MITIDRYRLEKQLSVEEQRFHQMHPKSYEIYIRARRSLQRSTNAMDDPLGRFLSGFR